MAALRLPGDERIWSNGSRRYSVAELVADGAVHIVGLVVSVAASAILLAFAIFGTAQAEIPALLVYIVTLIGVLSISLAFNLSPVSRLKSVLARLDQAAIFLFIAGTYTPFLAMIADTDIGRYLAIGVWTSALAGCVLKLFAPARFGRIAILLYLAIGWSGVIAYPSLAAVLPSLALWLIVGGGIAYTLGIIFHLWGRLHFQNVLWHAFVVAGASLHLAAVLYCMVLIRL